MLGAPVLDFAIDTLATVEELGSFSPIACAWLTARCLADAMKLRQRYLRRRVAPTLARYIIYSVLSAFYMVPQSSILTTATARELPFAKQPRPRSTYTYVASNKEIFSTVVAICGKVQ
jgi:hypothetical protein